MAAILWIAAILVIINRGILKLKMNILVIKPYLGGDRREFNGKVFKGGFYPFFGRDIS
jgi:hypothetical protein